MRIIALSVLCLIGACSQATEELSYDFRGDARPHYDRTLSSVEVASLGDDITLLDVRLKEDYDADPQLLPGAVYRDPEAIAEWSSHLPTDKPVIVYCVKGKWVSQKAASYLSEQGRDVYSLDGGMVAWRETAQQATE